MAWSFNAPPKKKIVFTCKLCGQVTDTTAGLVWAGWTGWICAGADACRARELKDQDPRMWSPWSR